MQPRRWWLSFLLLIATTTASASAHPLGNFTINHLAIVQATGHQLRIRYVLDVAEIPTFQMLHAASMREWSDAQVRIVTDDLAITVDGTPIALSPTGARATTRPGAGGLPTLYWSADFAAPLSAGVHRLAVTDRVYANRTIGWSDIVVGSHTDATDALRLYPSALVSSPRRVTQATFALASDGAVRDVALSETQTSVSGAASLVRSNALSDMFSSSNRTPLFVLFTMLVAFGLGALHAIEPGHGKALLAFTLVGSRATVRQAGILALSLTFAHTIGVLLLGIVLFFAAGFVSESIYPWITLLSGAAVAIIGARNLARYLHARGMVHAHAHTADHHHGDHDRDGHSHAIPGSGPIDFRAAIVAAMSGGIAPCPAAIVVMLAALRLHQLGYGILLIVIFSMGLAAVLTALGIAVVHGAAFLTKSARFERFIAAGPFVSAALISVVGAVMLGQGFVAQGVRASSWLIAALALVAIVGYALTPAHSHATEVTPA